MDMGARTAYSVDDLLTMTPPPGVKGYELHDGELITLGTAGSWHEIVKALTLRKLLTFVASRDLGMVLSESLFKLRDGYARIPDVAFISREKWAALPEDNVAIPVAPDLAIEVISESESATYAETKAEDYFSGGVLEVWQMYPREKRIRIRRPGSVRDVDGAALVETSLLPGFSVSAQEFFQK